MINYDSSETLHISVTDLNGREVLAKDLTSGNTEIDTRALTGGLFLLKAVNDKGMYITKVIKAK
jgi:hypothetical protein